MRPSLVLRGLYAVLDRDDEALAEALAAHACALQVRLKPSGRPSDAAEIVRVAKMARRVCDAAGIPLVINDRIDIALAVGAEVVHLGQTDMPLADARSLAGDRLAIGISTHDLDQVRAACAGGADYLGFGPVFATSTKVNPDAVQGIEGLRAAVAASTVPIVAIGGISIDHVGDVRATGAAAACAISAINATPDPAFAAASFVQRWGPSPITPSNLRD
jgi:thiamine-phosphate pyrophosphorylase